MIYLNFATKAALRRAKVSARRYEDALGNTGSGALAP
jgi:hypothetical protein